MPIKNKVWMFQPSDHVADEHSLVKFLERLKKIKKGFKASLLQG